MKTPKMYKKKQSVSMHTSLFLLVVLSFLFLVPYVRGADTTTSLLVYYTMDDADLSGTTIIDKANFTNATLYNTPTTGLTGVSGQAIGFAEASSEYAQSINVWGLSGTQNVTMCAYLQQQSVEDGFSLAVGEDSNGVLYSKFTYGHYTIGAYERYIDIRGEGWDTNIATGTGTWEYECASWNSSNKVAKIYVNGTLKGTSSPFTNQISFSNEHIKLAASITDPGYSGGQNVYIDEVTIYNRVLEPADIELLFNNTGNPFGAAAPSPPSLTLVTNFVNNTENYNLPTLNLTYNGTFTNENTEAVNCTLYNQSNIIDQREVNVTINQMVTLNFSDTFTGNYSFSVTCTNYEVTDATLSYEYAIDRVEPVIQIVSDFTNNTLYDIGDTVIITLSFNDTNLYATNITWLDTDGSSVLQQFLVEPVNGTLYQNTTRYTTVAKGNYTIVAEAWDSHTDEKLKYEYDQGLDWLSYNGVFITGDAFKSKTVKQWDDRVSYTVDVKQKNAEYNFTIIGSRSLVYISDSTHEGHFVDFTHKVWADFDSDQADVVRVDKLYDGAYLVTVYVYDDKVVVFNSIGDLNYAVKGYHYEVTDLALQAALDQASALQGVSEGINMLWFIILFIVFVLVPFIIPVPATDSKALLYFVSIVVFGVQLYILNSTSFFTIEDNFKYILNVLLFVFIVLYAMMAYEQGND